MTRGSIKIGNAERARKGRNNHLTDDNSPALKSARTKIIRSGNSKNERKKKPALKCSRGAVRTRPTRTSVSELNGNRLVNGSRFAAESVRAARLLQLGSRCRGSTAITTVATNLKKSFPYNGIG